MKVFRVSPEAKVTLEGTPVQSALRGAVHPGGGDGNDDLERGRAVQLDGNDPGAHAALVGLVAGGSEEHADGVDYGDDRPRSWSPSIRPTGSVPNPRVRVSSDFVTLVLDGGKYEGLLRFAGDEVHGGGYARVVFRRSDAGPLVADQRDADSPLRVGAQDHLDGRGASLPDAVGGLFEADGYLGALAYGDTPCSRPSDVRRRRCRSMLTTVSIRRPFAYGGGQSAEGEFDRFVVVVVVVVGGLEVKCLLSIAAVEHDARSGRCSREAVAPSCPVAVIGMVTVRSGIGSSGSPSPRRCSPSPTV